MIAPVSEPGSNSGSEPGPNPGPEPTAAADPASPTLAALLADIDKLRAVLKTWEPTQRNTASALEHALEALHAEALRRLLRGLKGEPACEQRLRELVGDEVIYAVLRHHGLLKASLNERIAEALAEVRPALREHGGDVELVEVVAPDTAVLRLTGACDGCPASAVTMTEGVEAAIRRACPEIHHIRTVAGSLSAQAPADVISPFDSEGWYSVVACERIPDGGVLAVTVAGRELLLTRSGEQLRCYDNACAHRGLPLDGGNIADGVLTCPHHGFSYYLDDGSCVSAPGVALLSHPLRLRADLVEVKLDGSE